jgi:hypothetical protein
MRHSFGFALGEKVEIREDAPFFERSNVLNDLVRNVLGESEELVSRYRVISDDDLKIYGRFAVPVGSQRGRDANHGRWKAACQPGDGGQKLLLLRERSRDVHASIIARCRRSRANPPLGDLALVHQLDEIWVDRLERIGGVAEFHVVGIVANALVDSYHHHATQFSERGARTAFLNCVVEFVHSRSEV